MIRAILTDIEGTTSSIAFVKEVLFPYARARLPDFVRSHVGDPRVRGLLEEVAVTCARPLDDEQAIAQLLDWIDEDRKIAPLKSLQGLIWEAGYQRGDFCGHVFPDAVRKLREWKEQGLKLYVFSSGSVHAQKLLFSHTEFGDLTPWFSGFFDTRIGSKLSSDAYLGIASQVALPPAELLFLSDIGGELDAAALAGMRTCQLLREGAVRCEGHLGAVDFDEVGVV